MPDIVTIDQPVPQLKAIRSIKYLLFSASIVPCLIAGAMAHTARRFNQDWFFWVTFAIFIAQVGGDYYYYYFTHYHTDQRDAHTKIFAGWKPLFTGTLIKPEHTVFAGTVCLLLAFFIGIFFYIQLGNTVILLAGIGGAVAVFFTPLTLRGLKEPVIFITFGPLVLLSVYYVLTRELSITPVWVSLPAAFLVTLVAYLKSDRFDVQETDSGCVVLNINVNIIRWLAGLAYLSLIVLIIIRIIPAWSLLALITVPFAYLITRKINQEQKAVDYLWATVYSLIVYVVTGGLVALGFML